MNTYYRWCEVHGEWPMYIDELLCPKCIEPELTEVQLLREENDFLKAALASPQPGKEQNLYFQLQACREELTNVKEAFARLREDRDMHSEMRQTNHKLALEQFEENLELQKEINYLKLRLV